MKDKIYIYNWKGIRTGWDYLLAVYCADHDVMSGYLYTELADKDILDPDDHSKLNTSNPNIVMLPYGCCDPQKLEMEFDKYPIGLPATPIFTIKWYMSDIPNTSDYDDFLSAIYKPRLFAYTNIPLESDDTLRHQVWTGTTYRLFVKCNSNAENNVNIYREYFTGIQREGIDEESNKWDIKTDELSIKVEHYSTLLMDAQFFIGGNRIGYYSPLEGWDDGRYLERHWLTETGDVIIKSEAVDYVISDVNYSMIQEGNFRFYNFKKSIIDWLDHVAQSVYKLLLRDNDAICYWTFPTVRYYKQQHDGRGNLGVLLNGDYSNIYILGIVREKPTSDYGAVGGLFYLHEKNSLPANYRIKDFYADIFEDALSKAIFITSKGMQGLFASNIYGGTYIEVDATEFVIDKFKCDDIKVKLSNDTLKTVTSSMFEHLSDKSDFKDIDKYEKKISGTRNQTAFTIPIVFNNMPTLCRYKKKKDSTFSHFYYAIRKLYYNDTVLDKMVRVHDHCTAYFGDFNSSQLSGMSFSPIDTRGYSYGYSYNTDLGSEMRCMKLQDNSCKPKIFADALALLFGNTDLASIEVEIPYNEGVEFKNDGSGRGWFWLDMTTKYIFDLFEEKSVLDYLPKISGHNKWIPTKVVMDFEKETANLELKLQTQIADA